MLRVSISLDENSFIATCPLQVLGSDDFVQSFCLLLSSISLNFTQMPGAVSETQSLSSLALQGWDGD